MNHKPDSVTKTQGFGVAICLETTLQPVSVQSTRSIGRAALLLFDFAPDEVCLLYFGKPKYSMPVLLPIPRWALTPPFHPYLLIWASPNQSGILSVALSVRKPFPVSCPGVTRHLALRSPDFPPCSSTCQGTGHDGSLVHRNSNSKTMNGQP